MAQVLKEEIREKIEQAALEEFYLKGYKGATMNKIAYRSGIPTGLIYSYFKNKEALFADIIKPVTTFVDLLLGGHPVPDKSGNNLFGNEIPRTIEMMDKYHKRLVILIDKSQGSPFEDRKDIIISAVADHLKNTRYLKNTGYAEIIYHIFATNFMEGVFEIARHYVNKEGAEEILDILVRQHLHGLSGLEIRNSSEP